MRRVIRKIARVRADGSPCEILEREEVVTFTDVNGQTQERGGVRDYILSSGEDLDPRPDGSFEIVQTGEIIRPA